MSLYKVVELVGTSQVSWDDAAKNAVDTARRTLADLRVAEVTRMDLKIEDDNILFRTRLSVSFKYHSDV